jgi:hypothetical protein
MVTVSFIYMINHRPGFVLLFPAGSRTKQTSISSAESIIASWKTMFFALGHRTTLCRNCNAESPPLITAIRDRVNV